MVESKPLNKCAYMLNTEASKEINWLHSILFLDDEYLKLNFYIQT